MEAAGKEGSATLHVLMFPFLAFGHISPFAQLARKLAVTGRVRITFLTTAGNLPRLATLLPSTPSVSVVPLHLPSVPGLPHGAESTADLSDSDAEILKVAVDHMKEEVDGLLRRLRPDFVLFDYSQQWVTTLAAPLGIKTLSFSVVSAINVAFFTVPSRRHLGHPSLVADDLMKPPVGFPSSSPIRSVPAYQAAGFLNMYKSFDGQPSMFDRIFAGVDGCDAVLIKTCMEIEGPYIQYLESQLNKKVLLAGPTVPGHPPGELQPRWAEWLSGFPEGAVVLSSFGSETVLADDAVAELLHGLEMAGYPFLVVLNFLDAGEDETWRRQLPEGFEERVRGWGLVHSGWVPQQHMLRHPSVGCFLCHAGYSSVVEGVVAGCRMVFLPQKADQFLNAALFARELRVGVEVRRREADGWFGRDAVCDAVKAVMAGVDEEGRRVGEEREKWRDFFMDGEVEERYTVELVERLEELAKN